MGMRSRWRPGFLEIALDEADPRGRIHAGRHRSMFPPSEVRASLKRNGGGVSRALVANQVGRTIMGIRKLTVRFVVRRCCLDGVGVLVAVAAALLAASAATAQTNYIVVDLHQAGWNRSVGEGIAAGKQQVGYIDLSHEHAALWYGTPESVVDLRHRPRITYPKVYTGLMV